MRRCDLSDVKSQTPFRAYLVSDRILKMTQYDVKWNPCTFTQTLSALLLIKKTSVRGFPIVSNEDDEGSPFLGE